MRTQTRVCEVAWFGDLCGGDTAYLGTLVPTRRSNYAYCLLRRHHADRLGFEDMVFFWGVLRPKTHPVAAVLVLACSPLIGLGCD